MSLCIFPSIALSEYALTSTELLFDRIDVTAANDRLPTVESAVEK
jgi:hypothetical protein